MTPRDRLHNALAGSGDDVCVLCPGGMMSMAVVEVMDRCGAVWPEAHLDAEAMLALALAMQSETGFDSIAMPFCMTIEAELYGAEIDFGSRTVQPRVRGIPFDPREDFALPEPDLLSGRTELLLSALRKARKARPDVALIGNVVGPFSLLSILTDPLEIMRWTHRRPEYLQRHLDALTSHLADFGTLQIEAGAGIITIAEPTATGEILGGKLFEDFALKRLNSLCDRFHAGGAHVIVHICGDARQIEGQLFRLKADAVSFDSVVDIVALAKRRPPWRVMGNVNSFLLAEGSREQARSASERLERGGVRLIAPACGVIPETPLANLAALAGREV